ncbi:MAG: hypothetical protein JJT96_09340 [Opitutales bacterium]|nr:hypothetical protein [Opitutales bacterium]
MRRFFDYPHARWILPLFVLSVAVWFVLAFRVVRSNDRMERIASADGGDPVAVRVVPGSSYFFTWGVTANPRSRVIAMRSLPEDERYGDTYTQAHGVLQQLTLDLSEVGLTLRDVAHVRAYVVGDAENPPDFDGWDRAFNEFFGTATMPHRPARTTVGISRLFINAYRIEVEFVAVIPDGRGPFVAGSVPAREYERSGRTETNEAWRSYGRLRWPMSTGKAVDAGHAILFSAGMLATPMNPRMPEARWLYGRVDAQAASILRKGEGILQEAGLTYADVFFMRTIMFPERNVGIGRNFGIFNREYSRFLNNPENPNKPTRTVMSAPGYTYRGQLMALEMFALFSPSNQPSFESGPLVGFGTGSVVGPAAVAVDAFAGHYWLSGVSVPDATGMSLEEEYRAAFAELEARLQRFGAGPQDVATLRAYIAADVPEAEAVAAWRSVANEWFEGLAPGPAVTLMPVVALPGGARVLLESFAAVRP